MSLFTSWQLKSRNPDTRKRAAEGLGVPGRAGHLALLVGLLDDPDAGVRAAAAGALGVIGVAGAVAPLARLAADTTRARDEDAVTARVAAVSALGRLGLEAAAPLSEAARDRHPRIREAAVNALASIGGAGTIPALAAALRDDRSNIRQAAAGALGSIGGDESERPLVAALDHKDAATRLAAVQALGTIANPQSVGPLARALGDRDKVVRESAVAALGRIRHAEAIAALVAAFEGPDRDVRQAAASVLSTTEWGPVDSHQRAIHAVLHGDLAAATAEGTAAVGPLLTRLGDRDPAMRLRAAEALGTIGDARAIGPLVSALGDHDESVRSAAARALTSLGPPAAPTVIAALDERSAVVRAAAMEILRAVGESRAMAPLIDAITHCTVKSVRTPRPVTLRAGVETATLLADDDVLATRRAVDTLQRMLEHAAGRVPTPELERIAAFRDLAAVRHKGQSDDGARTGAPDEISCDTLRRLAGLELERRRHDS